MIPMELPGISVVPMNLLTTGGEGGSGCGHKNTIFFDDVRVPAKNLVGGENNGWKVATTHLEVEHGGAGRLGDRRIIQEFIDYVKAGQNDHSLLDGAEAREAIVDLYIKSEVTRLFGLRNYWMAHTGQPRSYEGSQYSLRRKLSGLEIAEKMLEIAGPYALTSDTTYGPMNGALELYGREAITALHPGATTDIQRVIMSRCIGIGRQDREKAGTLR